MKDRRYVRFLTSPADESFERKSAALLRDASSVLDERPDPDAAAQAQHELLDSGLTVFRRMLNQSTAAALRRRLFHLEQVLSSLPREDFRWCRRYCKNMAYFSPTVQEFSQIVARAVASQVTHDAASWQSRAHSQRLRLGLST